MQRTGLSIEKYINSIKSSMASHTSKSLQFSWVNLRPLHNLQGLMQNENLGLLIWKLWRNSRQQQAEHETKCRNLLSIRDPVWLCKSHIPMKSALNETKMNTYGAFLCDRFNILSSLLQMILFNPHTDFVGWSLLQHIKKGNKAQRG